MFNERALVLLVLLLPGTVCAHGFGALYNLPVPLSLYNWAAAATLILSFLLAAVMWSRSANSAVPAAIDIRHATVVRALRRLLPLFRVLSVLLLLLCIATGFFGNRDPMRNFSPTFFWIIFLLGFAYLTALIGNAYAAISPLRSCTEFLARIAPILRSGFFRYPKQLHDWPALLLYLLFIAFELFGDGKPDSIAWFLTGYLLLNITGCAFIGAGDWFRHCEFFSVFFRLIAVLAPIEYQRETHDQKGCLSLRWPFAGAVREKPAHLSTLVFVLAMLSTTAFDGLIATQIWVYTFWSDPTGILSSLVGAKPIHAIAATQPWYLGWQLSWLFASPFIYLGGYCLALYIAKMLTRSALPVGELALAFGYSLLPIVLVYNITHYWTLLLTHGLKIFSFVSDPFGWRWDLFGTAFKFRAPIIPDMSFVWHSQVVLILVGHMISVWIAHRIALRIWPSNTQAMLSQLPMLVLMIAFTVAGLWILAQPLTELKMR